jgi:hypothetical protein
MAFIKELEDVLVLVKELPEGDQEHAAAFLRHIVMRAEEELTMTPEERTELTHLRAVEVGVLLDDIKDMILRHRKGRGR